MQHILTGKLLHCCCRLPDDPPTALRTHTPLPLLPLQEALHFHHLRHPSLATFYGVAILPPSYSDQCIACSRGGAAANGGSGSAEPGPAAADGAGDGTAAGGGAALDVVRGSGQGAGEEGSRGVLLLELCEGR